MARAARGVQNLDRLATHLVRTVVGTSAYNESQVAFVATSEFWVQRTDASVGERLRQAELSATVDAFLLARYSPETAAVLPQDRISIEGGDTYEVLGVRELQRGQWLEFRAVARADK